MMLERCPLPEVNAVAEVGCGSGKLLREVISRAAPALAVGIDPEREMLAQASGFEARLGSGEDLPIGDGAFHLVYYSQAFHLVEDKPRAVAELRRVLQPGGWAAIWTHPPEQVTGHFLNAYFPSMVEVDLARMEPPERWMRLLAEGGFPWVAEQAHVAARSTTLAALARAVRERYISTLALIPEAEFETGTTRLEADAARDPRRRLTYPVRWCLIWTRR